MNKYKMGNAIQMSIICSDLNEEFEDIDKQSTVIDNKQNNITQDTIENNITDKEKLDKWLGFVNCW